MGVEERLRDSVAMVLEECVRADTLPADAARAVDFSVERPKRPEHGDLATNVAMVLAKRLGRSPKELAATVAEGLRGSPHIAEVAVAGPGFLNVRFKPAAFQAILGEIAEKGRGYGRAPAATGERILIEFVSANPTGPLLVSHGRGAITGDAVARLLEAAGHRVVREYYVNDFGNQVRLLSASVRAASRGEPPPEGGYGAAYVHELAAYMSKHAPDALAGDDDALARLCVTRMLEGVPGSRDLPGIRKTLVDLGVAFDAWFSEEGLHRWGKVKSVLAELERGAWLEERDGALFFKSSQVRRGEGGTGVPSDDKDRVVRKTDGAYTYFASDIAYQADKIARGYDRLINVFGADHHGYLARVRNAIEALGLPQDRFEVLLYQLVSLLRDGKPYKMGKRLGNLVTVEEVIEEIDEAAGRKGAGSDALRYFYLVRRSDSPIELDIEVAKKSSMDNPVFYLQYGHARLLAILRRAKEVFGLEVPMVTPRLAERIVDPDELAILGRLGAFPRIVRDAAAARAPHALLFFLQELGQSFQSYYTRRKNEKDPILPMAADMTAGWETRWDRDHSLARLAWLDTIRTVYAAGLDLLGISAPERMIRPEGAAGAEESSAEDAGPTASPVGDKEAQ